MSRSTNLAVFFLKCSKRLCRIGRDRHPIFDSIKALSHGQIQKSSSFILCYCKFATRSLSKAKKIWKKTFPFQLKFNRFPTFHYVRGWLWLVPGQLFANTAALPPRLLPFLLSFSFLSCFAPYLYCRNPVLLVQQVNWGLQVSFSSESCSKPFPRGEFSLKHLPLWLPLPPSVFCAAPQTRARSLLLSSRLVPSSRLHCTHSLVRSFSPSRNHQVSTMTLVFSDIRFHVLSRVISEFILCILFKWWR